MKLNIANNPIELEVKRLYLEGLSVEWTCPSCGTLNIRDFGTDYLSYPTANEIDEYSVCCKECWDNYHFKGKLKLDFEIIDDILIKD